MNRREVVAGLAAGIALLPWRATAEQTARVWRVGMLSALPPPPSIVDSSAYAGLVEGMRELGAIEGRDYIVEWRFAGGQMDRLPALAAELVDLKVNVIVGSTRPVIAAAKGATASISIVMVFGADPVGQGLVASLARPGGNVTGLSTQVFDVFPKQVELLKAVAPQTERMAVLSCQAPEFATSEIARHLATDAKQLGVALSFFDVDLARLEETFARMSQERIQAMMGVSEPLYAHRDKLAQHAVDHRIIYTPLSREEVVAGALLSYGQNVRGSYRQAASYVHRILKGASPAELPVQQPLKFDLIVNLRTAKALGLTIPLSLLVRADEVIE